MRKAALAALVMAAYVIMSAQYAMAQSGGGGAKEGTPALNPAVPSAVGGTPAAGEKAKSAGERPGFNPAVPGAAAGANVESGKSNSGDRAGERPGFNPAVPSAVIEGTGKGK